MWRLNVRVLRVAFLQYIEILYMGILHFNKVLQMWILQLKAFFFAHGDPAV
jgi:hypothetical protein